LHLKFDIVRKNHLVEILDVLAKKKIIKHFRLDGYITNYDDDDNLIPDNCNDIIFNRIFKSGLHYIHLPTQLIRYGDGEHLNENLNINFLGSYFSSYSLDFIIPYHKFVDCDNFNHSNALANNKTHLTYLTTHMPIRNITFLGHTIKELLNYIENEFPLLKNSLKSICLIG
jgi:hypothetical protein